MNDKVQKPTKNEMLKQLASIFKSLEEGTVVPYELCRSTVISQGRTRFIFDVQDVNDAFNEHVKQHGYTSIIFQPK